MACHYVPSLDWGTHSLGRHPLSRTRTLPLLQLHRCAAWLGPRARWTRLWASEQGLNTVLLTRPDGLVRPQLASKVQPNRLLRHLIVEWLWSWGGGRRGGLGGWERGSGLGGWESPRRACQVALPTPPHDAGLLLLCVPCSLFLSASTSSCPCSCTFCCTCGYERCFMARPLPGAGAPVHAPFAHVYTHAHTHTHAFAHMHVQSCAHQRRLTILF